MSEHPDSLSPWWWPGAWLRIVYAVWFDQRWYWQHVRPRLHGRTEGWDVFVQGALGAALVSLVVAAPVAWLAAAVVADARGPLPVLAMGVGLGLLLPLVLGIVEGRRHGVAAGLAGCVARGPAGMVVAILIFDLHFAGGWGVLAGRSLALSAAWGLALGWCVGWSRGMYDALTGGAPGRMKDVVWEALFAGLLGTISDLLAAVMASVAFMAAYWLGVRWSTRQVADEEVRRRLANPEPQAETRAEARG